ncbi:hypothetical protein C8J56DRAFT_1039067 [Mycena floridula]|nr:hypothetical protein C8J56DRAFT_1039067 [Mycena floridula]
MPEQGQGSAFPIHHDEKDIDSNKAEKQWQVWHNEVLPALMPVYAKLVRETKSLSDLSSVRGSIACTGCDSGRIVKVYGVLLERIIHLELCTCCSIPVQLLQRGYFACSPKMPTLAVDINMLDFLNKLFVHVVPNQRAWAGSVEDFLRTQNYQLDSPPLSAVYSCTSMVHNFDLVFFKIQRTIEYTVMMKSRWAAMDQQLGMTIQGQAIISEKDVHFALEELDKLEEHQTCSEMDAIVCLDGNFTQKRCNGKSGDNSNNFPRTHPQTVFVPEEEVKLMAAEVEALCPEQPHQMESTDEADGYEGNVRVPRSVLKGCKESFTAADECRTKASTQFFTDTGLMALLCRHDRVLWLVNMTTAGERQYFALVLFRMLFRNLPSWVIIGGLYDVACILHQSCEKWGFLPEFKDRIIWGISVFHAYGHQWACQLIYHPQKCLGFGFTDGEACERLWKLLRHLIANLRVCGYYVRLYILDSQVKQIDVKSSMALGGWIQKKWIHLEQREKDAEKKQVSIGLNEALLRQEWVDQVKHQTKALPRQSKNAGKLAINQILDLKDRLDGEQEDLHRLQTLDIDEDDFLDPAEEIAASKRSIKDLQDQISKKKRLLNLDEVMNLNTLLGD